MASFAPILRLPAEASAQAGYKASSILRYRLRFMSCLGSKSARSKSVTYFLSVTKSWFYGSLLLLFVGISSPEVYSQELIVYKTIDTTALYLEIYPPPTSSTAKVPAMIFFFGGGWVGGNRSQFEPHANYFAQRGIKCFLADYRVRNKHQTTPFDALKDAKSAIRFLKANAERFQIDPNQIIAAGGSAGGHLAAATASINGFNDASDNIAISAIPNALVLFNPVVDNGPGGYGYERISEAYQAFSPLHNIRKGLPPTIFLVGTKDRLIPVETAEYYQVAMERAGNYCQLELYLDQPHGFFNYNRLENYKKTVLAVDQFLQKLGLISEFPKIEIK